MLRLLIETLPRRRAGGGIGGVDEEGGAGAAGVDGEAVRPGVEVDRPLMLMPFGLVIGGR